MKSSLSFSIIIIIEIVNKEEFYNILLKHIYKTKNKLIIRVKILIKNEIENG
jgi:hypothetical protein